MSATEENARGGQPAGEGGGGWGVAQRNPMGKGQA